MICLWMAVVTLYYSSTGSSEVEAAAAAAPRRAGAADPCAARSLCSEMDSACSEVRNVEREACLGASRPRPTPAPRLDSASASAALVAPLLDSCCCCLSNAALRAFSLALATCGKLAALSAAHVAAVPSSGMIRSRVPAYGTACRLLGSPAAASVDCTDCELPMDSLDLSPTLYLLPAVLLCAGKRAPPPPASIATRRPLTAVAIATDDR